MLGAASLFLVWGTAKPERETLKNRRIGSERAHRFERIQTAEQKRLSAAETEIAQAAAVEIHPDAARLRDALILALFEHDGEPALGVAQTCVLAKEMIQVVTAYNERSLAAGLPSLEVGIGISYQDSAPMYLMDGSKKIMISKALNLSDRLSGCAKIAKRLMTALLCDPSQSAGASR